MEQKPATYNTPDTLISWWWCGFFVGFFALRAAHARENSVRFAFIHNVETHITHAHKKPQTKQQVLTNTPTDRSHTNR